MSSPLRLLALGPALAVFLSGCSSSGRTNQNEPAGSRNAAESTASVPFDAEQTVRLLVGRAHGIEPGMLFRITYGAVSAGNLVVTRVFRDESLARFVSEGHELCTIEPRPGELAQSDPDPRLWTIEAWFSAGLSYMSWHEWGFKVDESGAGVRWVDSPRQDQPIRVPKEAVARIRSLCEHIRFDQLRDDYRAGVMDAATLTVRVTHREFAKRVQMYGPWALWFFDHLEPELPDRDHARRFLQLWDVITEVIPPPPDTSPWNVPAIEARVESIDTAGRKVVLSAGRHEGVVHGMRFYVSRGDCYIGEVEVRRVEMHRCTASVVRISEGGEIRRGDDAVTRL